MPRPRKLKNPRGIVAQVEAEVKEEMEKVRGRLSWGEFFTIMWKREKDYISLAAENENLRRENTELKARIEELMNLIQKLQFKLENLEKDQLPKHEKEARDLRDRIHSIIPDDGMKLIDLLRRLGDQSVGETLRAHAKTFIQQHFVQRGVSFVSDGLGLMIIPDERYSELAWIVKRIDSFRFQEGKLEGEVEADV